MTQGQDSSRKLVWRIFKKPSTIVASSIAIACGTLGYAGTRWLVTEKLPPFLEKQLSKTFERPLNLGKVEGFSFNSITFGESTVSVDDDDPDYVTADNVRVRFNILPVISRRVLPLEVTLIDPNVYLEQDKNGTWLQLPKSSKSEDGLPFKFDLSVIAESGEVALQPNNKQDLIELQLDGEVNYDGSQPEYIEYNLDTATGEAVANLEGKTGLKTGKTKAQILVEDLSLSKVVALLPNKPTVDIARGNLNADIDLIVPSLEEIDDTRIKGTASLQQLKASAKQLKKPIEAKSRLRFRSEKVGINNTQASIGNIVANINGRIDWHKGYDVDIVAPPVAISKLLEITATDLPVDVAGKAKADLQLRGAITEPVLRGTISNTQSIILAETKFEEVKAELTASLDKVILENLNIVPAAGGEITGGGIIDTGSDRQTQEPTPLSLQFEAQLPAEELLQPYYPTKVPLNIGVVKAEAKIDGTVDNPEVSANWQAPTVTTSAKADVSGSGEIAYNNSILAINNTEISLDSGGLDLNGTVNLEENTWQGVLNANNVTLNPFLQPLSERLKLGEPVTLQDSTVRLNGKTSQPLNTVGGVANLNFDVGSGDVAVKSNIDSRKLQVTANATDVPLDDFVTGVELTQPVDAKVNLSANLNSLENISIDANNIAVQLGEQNLNAEGEIVIVDSDLANVDLNFQTDSDLATLPNQLLNNASANNQFLAENFNLAGDASFDGRLRGQNLRSQPDLAVTGDLQLDGFSLSNTVFNPLSGTVDISPGETIAIALRGEQDVIAVNLKPCTRKSCPIPYLPTDIEIRQGEDSAEPIVATANRQGEFLDIDVANFPLSMLNLQAGLPGKIAGEATGETLVNLFTFATTGEVRVIEPSIGYIDGEAITTNFEYNPDRNLAKLDAATLRFGQSIYTLAGAYNLKTREIEADIDIPQAYTQDLISAFGWYNIQRVPELFQPPDIANSESLPTMQVGDEDARVGSSIELMTVVSERLEQMTDKSDFFTTPLDIVGAYQGKVNIAGSIDSPQVAWQITGDDWLWDTNQNIVFEIPRQQGIIAIDRLAIKGNYNPEIITLDSLSIEGTKSKLALAGKLQKSKVSAEYNLEDIPIDAIQNFVDIPFEIAGRISTTGEAKQTLQNPHLVGDVVLEDARLSDRALPKITGNYTYQNARLELDTTETPVAQIQASIPFPIKPNNDKASLSADIDEGGVALIDGFTRGALEFVGGEADITLNANTRLDLDADFIFQDLDLAAEASLNNSILKTASFTEPFNVTAEIAIDEQLVRVEQLKGTFANSDIAASGTLPIFESINNLDRPLTVTVYESQIEIDELYKGGVEGKGVITGNAISPLIGGNVELFDGRAFVPKSEDEAVDTELIRDEANDSGVAATGNERDTKKSAFKPKLKDFAVTLSDFRIQQAPLYKIVLEGDLILNGAANNVPDVKADGTLKLTRADANFVSNEFNLKQEYDNIVVFDPDTTILNPAIDVELETEAAELDDVDLGIVDDNEIPDPISVAGRNEIVDVTLDIEGQAEQIIPRVDEDSNPYCVTDSAFDPLFESKIYKQNELNQLAECMNGDAFKEGSARELLNSPAVELYSNPPRSQGAILSLLGNRFIGLAEQLQNSSEEELLEFGATQFILTPVEREVFDFTDGTINSIGNKIGLDYLQVYPAIEGTYQLTDDSSVNTTYDYFFNEVKLRYQKQF